MSANEILSDDGYRADGRRSEELRRLVCRMGHIANADGSAYLEQGNTKVLASVFGPHAIVSTRCSMYCIIQLVYFIIYILYISFIPY